jgi:hemolysin III
MQSHRDHPPQEPHSRELTADYWLHWIGLTAAPVAAAALLWSARHSRLQVLAGIVAYCVGLLAMIGCSALYNLARGSRHRSLFRRLDHSAIFLLIAGTYTPFALDGTLGSKGPLLLIGVWWLAAVGMGLKLLVPGALERTSIAIYLLLGWSGLAALDALWSAAPPSVVALLAAGGVLYTIGVLFHLWERLLYQNAIWHAFVLAGAACHYAAVFHELHAA